MQKLIARQQNGSFLIEVIIAGGLLTGLAIAAASFYKTRLKNQDYLMKLRELDEFHSSLTNTLQNSSHCNATFKEWAFQTKVPGSLAKDIKTIWLCGNNCSEDYDVSTVQRAASPLLTEATAQPTDETQWIPSDVQNLSNRKKHWHVKDMGMAPLKKSGKGVLKIIYELYPGTENSRRVSKSIELYFKFTPSSVGTPIFISCGSEKESSYRSVLQEMCDSLAKAATVPNGTAILAKWNHTQQECNLNSGPNCGYNQGLGGIDQEGLLKCQSLTKDVEGVNLYQPNDNDCSGDLRPAVNVDSNGKLRILCM
jgi:hypothetical protein